MCVGAPEVVNSLPQLVTHSHMALTKKNNGSLQYSHRSSVQAG